MVFSCRHVLIICSCCSLAAGETDRYEQHPVISPLTLLKVIVLFSLNLENVEHVFVRGVQTVFCLLL